MNRDISSTLSEDHAILRWLAARIPEAAPAGRRAQQFQRFARALGGHLSAIDQVVIPALKGHGWRSVSSSALLAHVRIKRELADMLAAGNASGSLDERLPGFLRDVEEHLRIEERELVPTVRRLIDPDEARSLGAQFTAQFGLLFDTRASWRSVEGPQELLDEARIVLSTLPTQPTA